MFRLLALLSLPLFTIPGFAIKPAPTQLNSPNAAPNNEVLSLLRRQGSASAEIYCYACRWAARLGDQPPPDNLIKEFEQIDQVFRQFYDLVNTQLVNLIISVVILSTSAFTVTRITVLHNVMLTCPIVGPSPARLRKRYHT